MGPASSRPRSGGGAPALRIGAALALAAICAVAVVCHGGGGGPSAQPQPDGGAEGAPPATDAGAEADAGAGGDAGAGTGGDAGSSGDVEPGWVTVAVEDFEHADLGSPPWHADPVPDDGPYADAGVFFTSQGITPPPAWRITQAFGDAGWLTAESYTRTRETAFSTLASVAPDPADPSNHALRIRSPLHTDATVIRSSAPLPMRYRISLRVGFGDFGDGQPGPNGYPPASADAMASPWSPDVAVRTQNGFYWLTILDTVPRPHNNTWIHHHRKVVIDVDNNDPPWTQIFDGSGFVIDGRHPVTMFAIDGRGAGTARAGKAFIAYSGGAWQPSGAVRSVDAYLSNTWYRVSVERFDTKFTLEISGRFRYGGEQTYRATLDAAERCVWHFNRTPQEDASACVNDAPLPGLGADFPQWPAGATWPDYFMFGDPHENFYAGEVYYDDVKLETWRP
jgi:hypothetical protein